MLWEWKSLDFPALAI